MTDVLPCVKEITAVHFGRETASSPFPYSEGHEQVKGFVGKLESAWCSQTNGQVVAVLFRLQWRGRVSILHSATDTVVCEEG